MIIYDIYPCAGADTGGAGPLHPLPEISE